MTLALVGVFSVVASTAWVGWSLAIERGIKWKLYALRDRLRWAAARDSAVLDSELFWEIDRSITTHCALLPYISLWVMAPTLLNRRYMKVLRARNREYDARLREAPPIIREINEEQIRLIVEHLRHRHRIVDAVIRVLAHFRSKNYLVRAVELVLGRPRSSEDEKLIPVW